MRCNTGLFWRTVRSDLPDDEGIAYHARSHDAECPQCEAHLQQLTDEYCKRFNLEVVPASVVMKEVADARRAIANLSNPDWLAEYWPLGTAAQIKAAIADEQAMIDTAGLP